LADSYGILAAFGIAAPRDVFPKAKAAVDRALEIDSTLAEAHVSSAFVLEYYEWKWLEAEKEYRRAIELDSTYATAMHWYALLLLIVGRDAEAVAMAEKAVQADPLSLPIAASLGTVYTSLRRYEEAEALCMKAIEMDSTFAMARTVLAQVYVREGRYEEAVREWEAVAALPTSTPEDRAYLGYGYARAGRTGEARRILDELSLRAKGRYVPPVFFAMIYDGLGEMDRMYEWLERAYEARDYYLTWMRIAIADEPAASDPRTVELLRRMGLGAPRTRGETVSIRGE
jgi:tetratricopeptide (TPR) repeat protein